MKRLFAGLLMAQVLAYSSVILAYETMTHRRLSEEAVAVSVLQTDPTVLANLGLQPLSEGQQQFPNSAGELRTISALFQDGSALEDDLPGSRFLHHFYDPVHDSPLTDITPDQITFLSIGHGAPFLPTQKSPDWALEDTVNVGTTQPFSFKDARQYFLKALTEQTKEERERNFGLTFQTLGHTIHHIQDMAQPQHVRNEQHPFHPTSLYERYTSDILKELHFSGYEPVFSRDEDLQIFNSARKFWYTGDGKGLAEFTNSNFISYGRNFTFAPGTDPNLPLGLRIGDIAPHPDYPFPTAAGGKIFRENVTIPVSAPVVVLGGPQSLAGEMYYVGTPVSDNHRRDQSGFNDRTSTFSIFDGDLNRLNLTVPCLSFMSAPPFPCVTQAVFSVNQLTMRDAHRFLIPRAVGYSAGLINYFFRGEIDFVPNPYNPDGFLIKNLGDEDLNGTFKLYYDSENENRIHLKTWTTNGALPPNGTMPVANFAPPTDPAPKIPGQYILVFQGKMGEEGSTSTALNPVFAVAGRVVRVGGGGLITTAGGDARGFAPPGAGGAVVIETGVPLSFASMAAMSLEVPEGETLTLTGGVHRFSEISIRGILRLGDDTILRSEGPTVISGAIEAQRATSEQDGGTLTIESLGPVIVLGRINAAGRNADRSGEGPQSGGVGGTVTIRTASTTPFSVPTIITRGGDAAFTNPRDPTQHFAGAPGGDITISSYGISPGVALQFAGERLPDEAVDPLPKQLGAHELPTRTTFHRGLLTTGGYGGQFTGLDNVMEEGAVGGDGGNITIDCQQPAQVQFDETDLFTGGNIDVLLEYDTAMVFSSGERPRFAFLVQRPGSMGGQGSYGGNQISGGSGGRGGAAGAITVSANCTLTPVPSTFTDPPRTAPLFDGVDPRGGITTKLSVVDAFDAAGNRLYTVQAFGGGGGIPGGSGLSIAQCSLDRSLCFVEDGASACPLTASHQTQICIAQLKGDPGLYGSRGTDGPVSCASLQIPLAFAGPGLICQ